MSDKKITPLKDPAQVPRGMSEREAREFWDTHEITEEYLEKAGPPREGVLPSTRARTRPVSVRLDEDVLRRLKAVAESKRKGYQTMLKEFIAERLYEEEKREGVLGESMKKDYDAPQWTELTEEDR